MVNNEAKEFAIRLNEALDLRKYPSFGRGRINYVQEIFDLSRAGANKWLHGKAIPHPKKRAEIATKLGISLKWLETGIGSPHDKNDILFQFSHALAHEIPLLNLRHAYQYKEFINNETIEKLVVNNTIPQTALAIYNAGASMEPKFPANALLIIDTEVATPTDGDYVVAKTTLLPEAIVRQFIKGSENNYLVAINSKFSPITINDEKVQIIGRIIEVRNTL
jgi:phage repressor protein C with HTH and peptisase S24 domain